MRAEELLVESEIAVQDAKHAGGDRIMTHDGERERPASPEGLGWAEQIRAAIAEGRFELHAEPVVGIVEDGQRRHELLPRMRSAGGELVPTAALMPAAERFGLAGEVDRWLLRSAIAALAREGSPGRLELSCRPGPPPTPTCPDSSPRRRARPARTPRGCPSRSPRAPPCTGLTATTLFLRRLADIGCEVGLDRFGAGVASFLHIERLPVAYVKLEPDLVAGLVGSKSARLVARSIADVACGLHLRSVATGVSDEQALRLLRGLELGYVQGPAVAADPPRERATARAARRAAPLRDPELLGVVLAVLAAVV